MREGRAFFFCCPVVGFHVFFKVLVEKMTGKNILDGKFVEANWTFTGACLRQVSEEMRKQNVVLERFFRRKF